MDNPVNTQLSYSSMGQLQTCEQKYAHRKVYNTPVDNEDVDRTAFDVGSATHHCVEFTDWGKKELTQKLVDEAVKEYKDAAPKKALVHGMALALIRQQELSGLSCVKAELQITSVKFNGFIDLIASYPNGDWYICDLKTSASKPNEGKIAMLPFDRQLNLYASYAKQAAEALGLDYEKFQGCIYRVVVKSKANQKPTESYGAFVKRISKLAKVYDIYIEKDQLSTKAITEMFNKAYDRSIELRAGEVPTKNLGACFDYFKPCEYFSQCHGAVGEAIIKQVVVKTAIDYENDLLDIGDL